MQSIDSQQENFQGELLKAEDLRNITLTPEELFEIQRENMVNSFMSSMVAAATKNARTFYAAQILVQQTDAKLVDAVIKDFEELGYKVNLSQEQSLGGQKVKALTIDWNEA